MIKPWDKAYQETKEILLGNKPIHPDFVPIADFISRQFGVTPINIIYHKQGDSKRPSLIVCVEYEAQAALFHDASNPPFLDKIKERLIIDYLKGLWAHSIHSKVKGIWSGSGAHQYVVRDIAIFFSAFESVAKMETNQRIPIADISRLKETIHHSDLWEISRIGSHVTFFLQTDQQVKELENSKEKKYWADLYFDLLVPYNEFDYFKRENFDILLDSKENFDQNYQSNWYYYFK